MFVIILLICLSVSVNCDDNDDGKYIDHLPEAEKREFLERVARRILEEVETKQDAKEPSVTLNDDKLDETSSYVSKLLNEEAADLKRRNMNLDLNKTKDSSNATLRGGDKDKEKYIDLTLRVGTDQLELEQGNIPEQKESTMTLNTGPGIGKESTTVTAEEAVTALPEKIIVDVIKTNDLPLNGIENVIEIKNIANSTQVVTTSSPIEDKTKRNFRRSDEKIDIQITIVDAKDTKSPKMKTGEEPPHVVYEDNFNKSKSVDANKTNESIRNDTVYPTLNSSTPNEIQDDSQSPQMRTNEEMIHDVHKDNFNKAIPVDANKSNESINRDIDISTSNSVNLNENYIHDSINLTPNLTHDNENQTISTQQRPLRNDRDIRESAREDDEFHDNSRRREVNVIPEEDENDKEVNLLPEDDVEVVTEKTTHSNVTNDIPEVLVTSIDTAGVTVTSTISSEGVVASADTEQPITSIKTPVVDDINTNALYDTVTSTEPVNITIVNSTSTKRSYITNKTTGLNFRASDIIWPQAENYSLIRVFDTTNAVKGTEVTSTTEKNIIEVTTDVKLMSVMSTNSRKMKNEIPNGQRNFRKNMEVASTTTLASNKLSTEEIISKIIKFDTVPDVEPKVPRNISLTTEVPISARRLYSHAPSNKVGEYPIKDEDNIQRNFTQEADSKITSEDTKPTTEVFANAALNKNDTSSIINKENSLLEVSQKPDIESTPKDQKPTPQEFPYFLRPNNTIIETPAHKSEPIYHPPDETTNITTKQPPTLHPVESVTQVRITRELDITTTGKVDDLTSNVENTKVELIVKNKKKAHKDKLESASTSLPEVKLESISEKGEQTTPAKAIISKNEYPLARAQKDDQETTTEVQLISVMNTKTQASSTNPTVDSVHVVRRIGEYESIDSEELTTLSNTEEIESTINKTANDFVTTASVVKVTSEGTNGLDTEPASEKPNSLADKSASKQSGEAASKPAYESVSKKADGSSSELLSEPTTKSATKTIEVRNHTVSEPPSDRASKSATEMATKSATEIHRTVASDENNDADSKSPSDIANPRASVLASKPKIETTSILFNEQAREPATELVTEISYETRNETSSQSPNNPASQRDSKLSSTQGNEITSKSTGESANERISESIQDSELTSETGNETTSKSVKSIAIEPSPQSIIGEISEVQQTTKTKIEAVELKESTTPLLPTPLLPTPPTNDQNSQIEKPANEPRHNLELKHVLTDSTAEGTTVAETRVTTTILPITTTDNGDIEIKTKKFDVESTSRNYDSSEIMTKVPKVIEAIAPNLVKSNKSEQVQSSRVSLQLGLVPEPVVPVTEKKFESLIKFQTTQVVKEYSVYEIRKYIVIDCMLCRSWVKRVLSVVASRDTYRNVCGTCND